MSKTAQRKAWNEAMRSAAGTAALPPALQPRTQKRRSDRRKKQDRRDKARKTTAIQGPESRELLAASWMDALEGVLATSGDKADGDGDDSYDELDELENKKGRKRRRKPTKKQQELAGSLPKRFKPRTVANILLEEVNRDDGVGYAWLEDEARITRHPATTGSSNNKRKGAIYTTAEFLQLPARKFCPVTGMEGIYTEPKSGLPYANLKALEQVRERAPPWINLGGSLAYHETVKSIRDEENEA